MASGNAPQSRRNGPWRPRNPSAIPRHRLTALLTRATTLTTGYPRPFRPTPHRVVRRWRTCRDPQVTPRCAPRVQQRRDGRHGRRRRHPAQSRHERRATRAARRRGKTLGRCTQWRAWRDRLEGRRSKTDRCGQRNEDAPSTERSVAPPCPVNCSPLSFGPASLVLRLSLQPHWRRIASTAGCALDVSREFTWGALALPPLRTCTDLAGRGCDGPARPCLAMDSASLSES